MSLLFVSGKKNQFYHMNGVRVLTVKSAMSGDRVQCSFFSDRSLSKHLRTHVKGNNFTLLYVEAYVIDVLSGSYFGVYGGI